MIQSITARVYSTPGGRLQSGVTFSRKSNRMAVRNETKLILESYTALAR